MKKLNSIIPLLILTLALVSTLIFPPLTSAATGDNCSVDLTSELPDSTNWNNITVLKGSDGYAWRRGTIQNPVDALYLKEGQTSDISALVGARAPTQFFIYAQSEKTQGSLNAPSEGVCFEGPVANDAGIAVFPINARAVWGNLGKKLVLDVFYRLPQKYDELSGNTTNENTQKQSLQLYTFILPRIVDVKLYVPPSTGSDNPLTSGTQTKPGKWESERDKTPQSDNASAGGECQSVGFACHQVSDYDGEKNVLGWNDKDWMPKYYYRLDPANICPKLLGNNFDAVGGNPVDIGIVGWGGNLRTHLARLVSSESNGIGDPKALYSVTSKSKVLEVLKRILEGPLISNEELIQADPLGAHSPIPDLILNKESYKIGSLTPDNLKNNAESNDIIKAIKILLTGSGDRNAAADNLTGQFFVPINTEYILELFPAASSDDSWAVDFLNILLFWTGSTTATPCVLDLDNSAGNFSRDFGGSVYEPIVGTGWRHMMGDTPLLLLNTLDPITLAPEFQDTVIVYADKAFDSANSWSLPAGKKKPLDYRYDFTKPFTKDRAGEMCVRKTDLSQLVSSFKKTYKLTSEETSVLSQELTSQFPATSGFVKVTMANPSDIASRISWLGDGKPLSILQLFFDFTPEACNKESLTPPSIQIPSDRDGFEVGVIE